AIRLPETDPLESRRLDGWGKHAPADDGDVFRRGVQLGEPGNVQIEVLVVQVPQQALGGDLLDTLDVHHIPRDRVNVALHRDLEVVVVAVEVGIAAHTERRLVLQVGQTPVEEPVGGVEMHAAGDHATGHRLYGLQVGTIFGARENKVTRFADRGGRLGAGGPVDVPEPPGVGVP